MSVGFALNGLLLVQSPANGHQETATRTRRVEPPRRVRCYGKVAAGLAVRVTAVFVGGVVYRRREQKSAAKQHHHVVFDSLRDLPDDLEAKLKKYLPLTVVIGEGQEGAGGGSAWQAIAGKSPRRLSGRPMARLRETRDEVVAAE
ncbi:MAG TPA: hypothetical protein VND96_05010 [Candidatus Micrarchaeaceae archaeon]|nr:hypothetical protein [Candidatus Micrarchaeaceae archaeon]